MTSLTEQELLALEALCNAATPGPWVLETVKTQVGVCHKIGNLGSTTKLKHACLYDDCYSNIPRDLQLLADAQLIAAARTALPRVLQELRDARAAQVNRQSQIEASLAVERRDKEKPCPPNR